MIEALHAAHPPKAYTGKDSTVFAVGIPSFLTLLPLSLSPPTPPCHAKQDPSPSRPPPALPFISADGTVA